ncbi:histidinol-phosphate transaminase [Paenisporosarcina cavernae]|uniref:Histidinol-phosphate aminotransferase n=1 Tax=Paenisporosarcina cavernae TaxID=2320858 RepID=A0A385YR32_9BACL|nr:histidinol-phosphate transaminase [Paenisporosarcina cavernae]AYC28457.1 histidinol-phosphate transaminase [Paenisporosarcina cavernae]
MENRIETSVRKELATMQSYSPGKPIWELQKEYGIEEVIKLSSNENALGASPAAKDAIAQYVASIHRYPDAHTSLLRDAISSVYDVERDNIIIGNGADEIIKLISETFLTSGDEVIVPTPSFSEYDFGANLMGATVVKVPLTETFEYDLTAVKKAITEKTKLIYLCSPNNPTGTYITREALETFLEDLPTNVLVVLDGAYAQYADANDFTDGIDLIGNKQPVIVIQTFSKVYGLAGLRVGFGIASNEIIQYLHKVREPFNVNSLAQAAAVAALEDEEHLNASKQLVVEGRKELYQAFEQLGLSYTESMANFVFVNVGVDATDVYEKLLRKGIIVRNGSVWNLLTHLRVTIGTPEENLRFIKALGECLEEVRPVDQRENRASFR